MNIEIELSKASVDSAIAQLKGYLQSLNDKNALFVKRLAELGIPVIDEKIEESEGDASKYHDTQIKIHSYGDYSEATLTVSGQDILFIEFGSGIFWNEESEAAHAGQFGYGVGTYPGQTHAFNTDPYGWWYRDETGAPQYSYGQQATAPMLQASHEIIANIRKIAREVYGSS